MFEEVGEVAEEALDGARIEGGGGVGAVKVEAGAAEDG